MNRQLTKSNYMGKCSTSVITRGMQTRATLKFFPSSHSGCHQEKKAKDETKMLARTHGAGTFADDWSG